jgi:hypothetical protein
MVQNKKNKIKNVFIFNFHLGILRLPVFCLILSFLLFACSESGKSVALEYKDIVDGELIEIGNSNIPASKDLFQSLTEKVDLMIVMEYNKEFKDKKFELDYLYYKSKYTKELEKEYDIK